MTDENHRDAGTGQFVTDEYAEDNPGTTVSETDARWWGKGQVPAVGRIVHYVSYGTPGGEFASQCRAAIITEVGAWVDVERGGEVEQDEVRVRIARQEFQPDTCALSVQNPTGQFFNVVPYSEQPEGGTWHWPERA